MTKNVDMRKGFVLTAFVLLIAVAFVGCDMLIGPPGEQGEQGETGATGEPGEQGPAGEGLYLVDANGVRIASGGSYYLGEAIEFEADVVNTFFLVNKSGVELQLVSVTAISSYQIRTTGAIINIDAVDEISVGSTVGHAIAHGASSDAITVTFEFFEWNGTGSHDGIAYKRLQIALTDGENDIFFNVKVYGVLSYGGAPE